MIEWLPFKVAAPGEKTDKTILKFASNAARRWSQGLCDFAEVLFAIPMRETIVHHPFTPEIEGCALHTGQGGQFRHIKVLFLLWKCARAPGAGEAPLGVSG